MENVYDKILGKKCLYQPKEGGLQVAGRLLRSDETSPTPFHIIDECGTHIGVELKQIKVLDSEHYPFLNGKEYIDRVI